MILPCPQCGSTKSLSSLRRRLSKVKARIKEEKRLARERKRKAEEKVRKAAALAAAKSSLNSIKVGGVLVSHRLLSGLDHHHSRTTISLGQIEGGLISNDDERDLVVINGVHLETCVDCGTFYAPNAREQADSIQTETYKLDLLGAMAGIYDDPAPPP
jgi:hypothetical protein